MKRKLLFCSLLSLLLMLVFSSNALANKSLELSSVTGKGTVTFNWIAVSAGHSISVNNNATVSLVATPAAGFEFSHWTGNVADTNSASTSIAMNYHAQTVSVVFVAKINIVTVTLAGSGNGNVTLSDGSISCAVSGSGGTCSFPDAAAVTLTARAQPGSSFSSWRGVDSVDSLHDNVASLAVGSSDHDVTATFDLAVKTISLYFSGDGTGSVTLVGSSSYETTSDGVYTFNISVDDSVTLTATADTGMDFDGWSGDVNSSANTIIVTLDSDKSIRVSFDEPTSAEVIAGCGTAVTIDYSSGFDAEDFSLTSVAIVDGNTLALETGNEALDPNSIVIPFEQEVRACFLNENAGYTSTLGWMLRNDAVQNPSDPNSAFKGWANIASTAKHPIFGKVSDCCDGGDGVLDILPSTEAALKTYNDPNAEGRFIVDGDNDVTPKDMCKSLGTFAAGTEMVFWLANNTGDWGTTRSNNIFYTKMDWNPDTFTSCFSGQRSYRLGDAITTNGCSIMDKGLFDSGTITRLQSLGLSFRKSTSTTPDIKTFNVINGQKFPHAITAVPQEDPKQWVLTWEDYFAGGDMDYNDTTFRLERKTGGSAQLLLTKAITPVETDAFFTAVTLVITDSMPGAGASQISYELSIDGGQNWVAVTHWDIVKKYPLDGDDNPITSTDLAADGIDITDTWTPGTPETTYRSVRVDFSGQDLSGDQLIWRANFTSDNELYQPSITDVQLEGSVATHGEVSRSTPVIQGNLLFDAGYETPASTWADSGLRGHLRAMRIYDPVHPSATDYVELWDAGTKLQAKEPRDRVITYPQMVITAVAAESIGTGDGTQRTFTGTLASHPVLATTVKITDSRETFNDVYINDLVGSLSQGVTGTINRYTGEFSVTFDEAPGNDVAVTASYSSYALTGNLVNFTRANTPDNVLAINGSYLNGTGYNFDFDADGDFDTNDGNWLVNWTRGYVNGAATKKEGILGPIDHSVPAVVTAPGKSSWYYGTSITHTERASFDTFREENEERPTLVMIGSRNGMLHAFDAGNFRWGNNPATLNVEEKRGYFLWPDDSESSYDELQSWWTHYLGSLAATDPPYFRWRNLNLGLGLGKQSPDYGTGEELWAFIPANLMPRLKNNVLNGADRAYVDASPAFADVYIDADDDGDKEWRTVVMSAEGNGGDTIFCLDVTDTTAPAFLWEFSAPELFRSRSSPAVAVIGRILDVNDNETKWVAFFVSGRNYDPNSYPSVYMVDIDTGAVLKKIVLDAIEAGKGGVPSGQPAIVDSDGNGYIDRAYIGTDKGYLYKINFPDNTMNAGSLSTVLVNADFTDEKGNTVDLDQRYHPIYGSPSVVVDNGLNDNGTIDYNVRIFFGTGDSPYYDEDINTDNTRYHFFAYNDKSGKGVTNNTDIRLEWFLELPAGQRVFASAFAAAGQIYFGTATGETEDPCEGPNEGRIYAFTYEGVSVLNDDSGNLGKEVGDQYTSPLVEDEHLYIRATEGIKSYGDNNYNNDVKQGGLPSTNMTYWREIF